MSESKSYWAAIYFHSSDRKQANTIINTIADDGVFLVRDGTQGHKVLVVYIENKSKKFVIERESHGYFLTSNHEVIFPSVEELLHYYYTNPLPRYEVYLTLPYKLHEHFHPDMLR